MERSLLSRLAEWLYRESQHSILECPIVAAQQLGLRLMPLPVGGGATLMAETIIWDPTVAEARQRALVLRELSRWTLRQHGLDDSTETSTELAKASYGYAVKRRSMKEISAPAGASRLVAGGLKPLRATRHSQQSAREVSESRRRRGRSQSS